MVVSVSTLTLVVDDEEDVVAGVGCAVVGGAREQELAVEDAR